MLDNLLEKRLEVRSHLVRVIGRTAKSARTENNGAVELFLGRVKVEQKLQNLVHNLVVACVGAVGFVHNDNNLVTKLQRFLKNEARLRHRTLEAVHEQQNAVYHLQNTLNLSRKIRVSGSIDNINFHAVVHTGRVLRENCNSALALKVVVVHNAVVHNLIVAKRAALLQHLVYERCFSVVNMRDYRDIP